MYIFVYIYIYTIQRTSHRNWPWQVMEKDLFEMGYILEYSKVDAQSYLLPQRRNRVYASIDVCDGQDANDYASKMKRTMDDLSSDVHVPDHLLFDDSLPQEALSTDRQATKLKEALELTLLKSQSQNIFLDCSTSTGRLPEYAVNALTCVRPCPSIYSYRMKRFVTVKEMWLAQGLFPHNFANPTAVEQALTHLAEAQDLAGNAFASTCMQARVLASLVHSHGWGCLDGAPSIKPLGQRSQTGGLSDIDQGDSACDEQSSWTVDLKRKASALSSDDISVEESKLLKLKQAEGPVAEVELPAGQKRKADNMIGRKHEELIVVKRARGKTNPAAVSVPQSQVQSALVQHEDDMNSEADDQPMKDRKEKLERLRQNNAKKNSLTGRGVPGRPKRKYTQAAKVAREGKKSSISIWMKMEHLKDLALFVCLLCMHLNSWENWNCIYHCFLGLYIYATNKSVQIEYVGKIFIFWSGV